MGGFGRGAVAGTGATRRSGRRGFDDAAAAGEDSELDPPADPESAARAICLRLLEGRARTRAELATELRRREVPADVAQAVLDRYAELGLVDDVALAESFALARHSGRAQTGNAIAVALRRRGVADDVITDAIALIDPASEIEAAYELARARLARMSSVDPPVAMRRLTGLLARRGYSSSLSYAAVRAALAQHAEQVDELDGIDGLDSVEGDD